jgi:D-3-phosphoglycerate dehydrogenase / 2-oxoglutarate reductase
MMMKIIKTDGIIPTSSDNIARIEAAGAKLEEHICLTEEALIEHCSDADGLLVLREPVTARVIRSLRQCRVIARFGIGVDMIDLEAAAEAGITVTNVPDANVEEVAVHTVAMALALSRRLCAFDADMRQNRWFPLAVGKGMLRPDHQVFGLLGLGRIGALVAERIRPFGFRIIAHDHFAPVLPGVEMVSFDALMRTADILSLHLPLTDQSTNIIDEAAIRAMKPGAILINASRGGLVDEAALACALTDGDLGGAGIDTFATEPVTADNPLLRAPNMLLSPHVAHFSEQSIAETRDKAFDDIVRVLSGQPPAYPVITVRAENIASRV